MRWTLLRDPLGINRPSCAHRMVYEVLPHEVIVDAPRDHAVAFAARVVVAGHVHALRLGILSHAAENGNRSDVQSPPAVIQPAHPFSHLIVDVARDAVKGAVPLKG